MHWTICSTVFVIAHISETACEKLGNISARNPPCSYFFFFFKHQEPVPSWRCPLITLLYCTQLFIQVPRASTLEVQQKSKKRRRLALQNNPFSRPKLYVPKCHIKDVTLTSVCSVGFKALAYLKQHF